MPTAFVTGAAGFLGGLAADEFERRGWKVLRCGRAPRSGSSRPDLFALELPDDAVVDLLRRERPEVCVHCAGNADPRQSVRDPARDFVNGPQLTAWLLERLRQHAPGCRVVFPSSAAVYGEPTDLPIGETVPNRPLSPYGYHKLESELVLESFGKVFGIATVALRIFSAYGPGLHKQVIWDLLEKIAAGPVLTVEGTGRESRDFVFGEDVARAMFHAATLQAPDPVYNVAAGVETTIGALVTMLLARLGVERDVRFTNASPAGVPRNWRADISRIGRSGWSPTVPLEEGLGRTVEAWRQGREAT